MYLFFYFIFYFLFVFVIRSYLMWKKTGVNPLVFDKSDDAHGFNGRVFAMISVLELIVIAIYAFKNEWYEYLLPFWYLENPTLVIIAWTLLIISLLIVWLAQAQMASSWRIGIDVKNKTRLVTKGLFSISRNPVFLAIMIANLAMFLIIPNAFTLVILSLSALSTSTQIRLEEDFLKHELGDEYLLYFKKVRRWL